MMALARIPQSNNTQKVCYYSDKNMTCKDNHWHLRTSVMYQNYHPSQCWFSALRPVGGMYCYLYVIDELFQLVT